jgi:hypothetical protein
MLATKDVLWAQRNGFEIVLFVVGGILTIGLFVFFVVMFHREREDPPSS